MFVLGKLQFAVDCAQRLFERSPTHPKTMTSLLKLHNHWTAKITADEKKSLLKTDEVVAELDITVNEFVKVAEKLESELKVKTPKTISEWSELLNLSIALGHDHKWDSLTNDLKQATRVRHDDLVSIEKKLTKMQGMVSIKALCKDMFPKSTYFC